MSQAKTVQHIARQQHQLFLHSGIVRAIRGQYVDIVLDGTKKQVRDVILPKSIEIIEVGWWVVIIRAPRKRKWIAVAAYEGITGGSRFTVSDLSQPTGVTATGKPYFIELSWDGSFHAEATFEVQHNSSGSETGATMIKVEGSNCFYWCAPGTQRYFRVRAVSSSYERSSWSDWVDATATSGDPYMTLGINTGGTAPEWQPFDWDNVAAVSGAVMVHGHSEDAKGGTFPLLILTDGVAAPSPTGGLAKCYVDSTDGNLKVIFGDGAIAVLGRFTHQPSISESIGVTDSPTVVIRPQISPSDAVSIAESVTISIV